MTSTSAGGPAMQYDNGNILIIFTLLIQTGVCTTRSGEETPKGSQFTGLIAASAT